MADLKISELNNLTGADPILDMLPIVDVSATPPASGSTKRISINNILSSSPTASGNFTITGALTVDSTTLVANAAGYTDRVGIGTATPAYPLQVVGNAVFNADATCKRFFVNDTTGNGNVYINGANGSQSVINLGGQTNYNIGAIIYDDASNYLLFKTNSVEAARFNSTGNLVFPSAKGIDFSAVTGGTGTATANVLNDYEEGTFVPTLSGGTTQPATLINGTGRYTKIGRVVTVQIYFNGVNTTGYSGLLGITGLPFTNNGSVGSAGTVSFYNLATFTGSPFIVLGVNESFLNCFSNISSSAFANVTHNAGASGNYLTTSITYIVA